MMPQMPPFMMPPWGMNMNMMNQGQESSSDDEETQRNAEPKAASATATAAAPPAPIAASAGSGDMVVTDGDAVVSRSVSCLRALPRTRLSEILEKLDPAFEATLTSELSQAGLLAVLFLFTRLKPNTQVCVLSSLG